MKANYKGKTPFNVESLLGFKLPVLTVGDSTNGKYIKQERIGDRLVIYFTECKNSIPHF